VTGKTSAQRRHGMNRVSAGDQARVTGVRTVSGRRSGADDLEQHPASQPSPHQVRW
jgi:hypothetical protein